MASLSNNRMPRLPTVVSVALLLGCILVVMMGEFLVVKVVQWDIRREMATKIKSGLPDEQILLIKISNRNIPADFVRKEAHEFRYRGGAYDIIQEEIHGDTTYFYCVFDERETTLYAKIDQRIADEMSNNPERQQQREQLRKKIPKFFFFHTDPFLISFKWYSELPMSRLLARSDVFTRPPTPPPDKV